MIYDKWSVKMRKIYCGSKTVSNYLWGIAKELKCESEIQEQLGTIYTHTRKELNARTQYYAYVSRLAWLVLGSGKFTIGYMAITKNKTYYSDNLRNILIQLTGFPKLTKATEYIGKIAKCNPTTLYQAISYNNTLSTKQADFIMQAGNCLLLLCLSEGKECFGPGTNFSKADDWELIFDSDVQYEMEKQVSVKPMAEYNPIDPIEYETTIKPECDLSILELFEQLTPSMKKLILEFARERAKCKNLTNDQIVLGYCMSAVNDHSIEDLIKISAK